MKWLVGSALVTMCTGQSMVGYGYSSDTQQVAQQACYGGSIQTTNRETSHIELSTALSFDDLQEAVRRSVGVKAGVGMFDIDAEASYLKVIEDKEYSMSLNYYQYTSASVEIQLNATGLEGLTSFGQQMYANGTNPYFGVVCGDSYLTSYEEGALLMLSINVVMSCKEEVEEFKTSIVAGLTDIVSATTSVQKITAQRAFTGRVEMSAFQVGGQPSNLAKILAKDSSQQYYVLTCEFGAMADCQKAASGLLDYATQNFSSQISFQPSKGLTYLGEGFYTYEPMSYIGLKPPSSMVTSEVVTARENLASALRENMYYLQSFYPLKTSYAVPWNLTSSAYKNIMSGFNAAHDNIAAILGYNNPEQGGKGCYDLPDHCVQLSKSIISSLATIKPFLSFLPDIQYVLPVGVRTSDDMLAILFPNGVGYSASPLPPASNGDKFSSLSSLTMNSTFLKYTIDYQSAQGKHGTPYKNSFNGTSPSGALTFTGKSCDEKVGDHKSLECTTQTFTKRQSGYFFGPFSPSK